MGNFRRTKIVATIGPAIDSKEKLIAMAKAGTNVFRFNFSHSTREYFEEKRELIRKVSEECDLPLGILLDTKGPEIRTGLMENGSVEVEQGQEIEVTYDDVVGTKERIRIDCRQMFDAIRPLDSILIDDGKIKLVVEEKKDDTHIRCSVYNSGVIKDRKGVNVPFIHIDMPYVSEKDDGDIRFCLQHDIDFIAASFVRTADDIKQIRRILVQEGKPEVQIYAKIENQEGYDNIDAILEASDGIMVARGDLGVEVATEMVPIYQKIMIRKCNDANKPAITATQMLESMTSNPRPTRAEASDVANAILDGTDAIMLSGESSVGLYPVEAVEAMDAIACSLEDIFPYRDYLEREQMIAEATVQDCIASGVAESCLTLPDIKAIIVFTESGLTAKRVSKYRPKCPILAVTFNRDVQRSLSLTWGVTPCFSRIQNNEQNEYQLACGIAKLNGINVGDKIIISAGYPAGIGNTNMMKIVEVR